MKKVLHWCWIFLEILIIIYVIFVTLLILCRNKYGYTQFGDYTFVSASEQEVREIDEIKKDDLLIIKNNDIKNKDLIYYYIVYDDKYIVSSSKVSKIEDKDWYTIEGESEISIAADKVIGNYLVSYKKLGGLLNFIESKIGFFLLVLLPIMIVFIYQVHEFIVIIRHENDEDYDLESKVEEQKEEDVNEIEKIDLKSDRQSQKSISKIDDIELL